MALPTNHTIPDKFTSTYNQSYRDRKMFISPHPSQPMYHYSNAYDPSHFDGFNAGRLENPSFSNTANSQSSLPPIDQQTMQQTTQQQQQRPASQANSAPRDLWDSGVKPHTGVYSNNALPGPNRSDVVWEGTREGGPARAGYGGFATYDGMAGTRALDQARSKSHVPGYAGFVRGEQFRHGETYGRVSRRCLDVPTAFPLEP